MSAYEVLAVRYGTRMTKRSHVFLNHHVYGEPDTDLSMDYFFWVIRNHERTIVVDTGFSAAVGIARGRELLIDPIDALRELGIEAAAVEQLVITHFHYDHIGNLAAFPSAEVVVAARELEFWRSPVSRKEQFFHPLETHELADVERAYREGRVRPIAEDEFIAPGVRVIRTGGHTPGQAIVVVDTAQGTAILASDALHYYEELEKDRPFAVVGDLEEMYTAFDVLRELSAHPGAVLVAGHDPRVAEQFALNTDETAYVIAGGRR